MKSNPRRGAAILVAAGIFLSRIAGLIRDRVFAHYFGAHSDAADAFRAATRIPNILQNLFGEGVLSASFIPVYAKLLAQGDEAEAGRLAGAIFAILSLLTSGLVLLGVLAAPWLSPFISPGFHGEKLELTITMVRILFPGIGLLVLSAWCLGILNSHRRFLLSYSAPVLWNAFMIGGFLVFGNRMSMSQLAVRVAWVSVAGSAAQFLVQLPFVLRLAPELRIRLTTRLESVRSVIRSFVPVFISRGVAQISGYIDNLLSSLLGTGAVTVLSYAQTISMLPVSLFGMAISASELPEMSSATGTEDEIASYLRTRLQGGLRRIAFFVVPSAVAFAAFGDVIAAALYQSRNGLFTAEDSIWLWTILAGSSVGLLASTQSRLFSSTFWAMKDTRTPLRFAILRVILTTVLGYLCSKPLTHALGISEKWGVAGLTASAGISGWVEYVFLRRALAERIGVASVGGGYLARLWIVGLSAAAVGWTVKLAIGPIQPILRGFAILGPFGIFYLAAADPSNVKRLLRR